MNELSYRLMLYYFRWIVFFATPIFVAINYILIESTSDISSSAYEYYLDISILSLRPLQIANTPEYNRWRYWYFPSMCAHLGTDIPFLHRRPLSRHYKFAFDCIATCTRTRMYMFGVKCVRADTGMHLPYLHGASSIMSICRCDDDSLR